ncbi:hypothetical protein SAMD00019534_087330 [Acytostelium subglobosum LB1]|uniref:hypothetical protein n=1 Tax=Acytostelium subglobosum LB1 TaxID=1410327 RepID=UPI000645075D|nr:hypothetical protein SAMD00019534_087330 [Acytostelium subglobosum LB1]GAM25558.1 hypothetical protein SAMD00019534_087330 [Acytostelium subglobosum LB1]|eukprot:XP_012751544.1 hypothetical protein SAMD00019534_087330 [Acytostelium subglobosum LB1]
MGASFVQEYPKLEKHLLDGLAHSITYRYIDYLVLFDGLTSSFKLANQPLPSSLVKGLESLSLYNFKNIAQKVHFDGIARGMLGVFEETKDTRFIQFFFSSLIRHKTECTDLISMAIDMYSTELKSFLANPMQEIQAMVGNFSNIELLVKCHQLSMLNDVQIDTITRYLIDTNDPMTFDRIVHPISMICANPSQTWIQHIDNKLFPESNSYNYPRVSTKSLVLQLVHFGLTLPSFHLLKYSYCYQARYKKFKHLLFGAIPHDHIFDEQLKLFKKFKQNSFNHSIIVEDDQDSQQNGTETIHPTLPLIILNQIIKHCLKDDSYGQQWFWELSSVSKHFHKICASTLTNQSLPWIKIHSSLDYIGSPFCLFQDTPLCMHAFKLIHIPTKHLARCLERLEHLTVPFINDNGYHPAFVVVKTQHLHHLAFVQYKNDEDEFKDIDGLRLIKKQDNDRNEYVKYSNEVGKYIEDPLKYMQQFYFDNNPGLQTVEHTSNFIILPEFDYGTAGVKILTRTVRLEGDRDSSDFGDDYHEPLTGLPIYLSIEGLHFSQYTESLVYYNNVSNLHLNWKHPPPKIGRVIPQDQGFPQLQDLQQLQQFYAANKCKTFELTMDVQIGREQTISNHIMGSLDSQMEALVANLNQLSLFGTLTSFSIFIEDEFHDQRVFQHPALNALQLPSLPK